jgi:hypothetical protein
MDCQKRSEAAGTNCKVKSKRTLDIRAIYEHNLLITGVIVIPNCSILRAKYWGPCEVDTYVAVCQTCNFLHTYFHH